MGPEGRQSGHWGRAPREGNGPWLLPLALPASRTPEASSSASPQTPHLMFCLTTGPPSLSYHLSGSPFLLHRIVSFRIQCCHQAGGTTNRGTESHSHSMDGGNSGPRRWTTAPQAPMPAACVLSLGAAHCLCHLAFCELHAVGMDGPWPSRGCEALAGKSPTASSFSGQTSACRRP